LRVEPLITEEAEVGCTRLEGPVTEEEGIIREEEEKYGVFREDSLVIDPG